MHCCILCETPLVGAARSREHVIPASLGGKRRTVKVLCRECNSTTGHSWDAELERQLRPAALLVFPHDHPCGRKQRRVADAEGNHLILTGGIRGGAESPQIRTKMVAGRPELQISAPNRQRAVQESAALSSKADCLLIGRKKSSHRSRGKRRRPVSSFWRSEALVGPWHGTPC